MKTALALVLALLSISCATTQQLDAGPAEEVVAFQVAPLAAMRSLPAAPETGYLYSFTATCGDAGATLIAPPVTVGAVHEMTCQVASTTIVAFGDSTLADPAIATRAEPVYCTTNCPSATWTRAVHKAYCRSDLGNVVVYCDAVVRATDAP